MALSADLLSILVCPQCKGDLTYDAQALTLTCGRCRLRYKVVDDIHVSSDAWDGSDQVPGTCAHSNRVASAAKAS